MTATPAGMTYADYLELDSLLSAQHPRSDLHDEMLFIVIHQTKELWLKQMLHELGLACALVRRDQFAEAYKALARISRIQAVMTLSWDVLATLTPVDYSAFRDVLGTSSGFQSAQFRELEFRLGLKDASYLDYHEGGSEGHARLVAALEQPSLWDEANDALARAGFDLGDRSSDAIEAAWTAVYRDSDALVRALPAGRETGRHRRCAGGMAAQACADDHADHRAQARHRRIGGRGLSAGDADQARLSRTLVAEDRLVSFKDLFSKSLGAAPGRLHFAAHSHHLWPDASFAGQVECWDDAARLADHKWDAGDGRGVARGAGPCRRRAGHAATRRRSCSRRTRMIS